MPALNANEPKDLYPLATPDGQQIRHDIANPACFSILVMAIGGLSYVVEDTTKLVSVVSSVGCQVVFDVPNLKLGAGKFSGIVAMPDERVTFGLPNKVRAFTIFPLDDTRLGDCIVQEFYTWQGLSTSARTQFK